MFLKHIDVNILKKFLIYFKTLKSIFINIFERHNREILLKSHGGHYKSDDRMTGNQHASEILSTLEYVFRHDFVLKRYRRGWTEKRIFKPS